MEFLQQILHWLNVFATYAAPFLVDGIILTVAATFLSGILVAPYRWIKKTFEHYKEVMAVVVVIAGMVGANIVHYFIDNPANPIVIYLQGLAAAGLSQPIYKVLLKPLGTRVWQRVLEAAHRLNKDVTDAVAPVMSSSTVTTSGTTMTMSTPTVQIPVAQDGTRPNKTIFDNQEVLLTPTPPINDFKI